MKIDVTEATAELVERCAPLVPGLVHATGPASYDYQFGPRSRLFDDVILASWRTPGTLFSHTASTLALCADGPAGLAIGFGGAHFYAFRDALAGVVRELMASGRTTRSEAIGLAERAEKASYLNAHVPADVYYVLVLSVRERYRGRGIGARLLADATAKARAGGHRALQLDVLADNPAVAFYRAMGFGTLAEIRSPELTRHHGMPSELRMALAL